MDTDSNTEGLLSVRELHQCLEYTRNQEEEIEGLESLYRNLLRRSTVTTQTGSYITNVSKVFSEEREQDIFMIEYRMLDNIMYVLYE